MTQDKMRKLITACVVAATALLVFLLSVLVYQWITMGVQARREKQLKEEIAAYEEMLETAENDLEYYQSETYRSYKAIELYLQENK